MSPPRRMIVGIVTGAVAGAGANLAAAGSPGLVWFIGHVSDPIGQIFLRLLVMLVVTLLFSALVVGVGELDFRHLGRVGAKTLGYTVVVSAMAVAIGLIPSNGVKAAAEGDMIGWMVFSLCFGVALSVTRSAAADRLRELVQGL